MKSRAGPRVEGSLTRELERLQLAGILSMTRQGNQTHYQANPHARSTRAVAIVRKTFSLDEPLRNALAPLAEQITWAFWLHRQGRGALIQ
jgi:hypothetical protein